MNSAINNLLETGLTTIVGSSAIANTSNIAGSGLEAVSQNKYLQTAAKTLQSANIAFMGIWASINALDAFSISETLTSVTALTIGGVALSIPTLTLLGKKLFPGNLEKIEAFEKFYGVILKLINIVAASMALGLGIYLGYAAPTLALSTISLMASTFNILKNPAITKA